VAAILAAVGGVFFESTSKAALSALTPLEHRAAGFSLYGVASRLGSAVGPALGVLLQQIDFAVMSLVAAAFYIVCFALFVTLMPPVALPRSAGAQPARPTLAQTLRLALRDRRLVWFVILNTGYWFLFSQFTITLPLYAFRVLGGLEVVSGYYLVNSVPAVFLQYPLLQQLNRRWSSALIMVVGMLFIALGMGSIGLWNQASLVIASASVYALGDLLYQPTQQTVISDMARPDVLGAYFGFASFALAVGGGLGNLFGGALFDAAASNGQPAMLWFGYGMIGLLLAIGLALWGKRR
jgi:DHA1 family multidrug resistance protein-like MFS transporter